MEGWVLDDALHHQWEDDQLLSGVQLHDDQHDWGAGLYQGKHRFEMSNRAEPSI